MAGLYGDAGRESYLDAIQAEVSSSSSASTTSSFTSSSACSALFGDAICQEDTPRVTSRSSSLAGSYQGTVEGETIRPFQL